MNYLLKNHKLITIASLLTMSLGCDRLWAPYLEIRPNTADQCQTDICATGAQGGTCDYDNKKNSWETCSRPNCSNRAFDFTCPGAPEPNTDGGVTDMGGMPTPPIEGMHSTGVTSYGSGTSQLICAPDQGPIKFMAGMNGSLQMSSSQWYWLDVTAPRIVRVLSNANRASGGTPLNFRVFDPNSLADKICASAQPGGCDVP